MMFKVKRDSCFFVWFGSILVWQNYFENEAEI